MRPRADAIELEIVGVGHGPALLLAWLLDAVGDAFARRIGDGFFLRIEPELDLLARVAGTRPSHQRLDLARLGLIEFEAPELGPAAPGLHGVLELSKDACA